jgi:hypothetical protein
VHRLDNALLVDQDEHRNGLGPVGAAGRAGRVEGDCHVKFFALEERANFVGLFLEVELVLGEGEVVHLGAVHLLRTGVLGGLDAVHQSRVGVARK